VSTIVLAVVLAFIFGWKLALVVLGFVPFLLLMGIFQRRMVVGLSVANRDVIENGGKVRLCFAFVNFTVYKDCINIHYLQNDTFQFVRFRLYQKL
jgi:hypothetical protein